MDYHNKIVVITGASSGIGYVTAKAFAHRGAVVMAVARREDRLQQLMRECQAASPASSYTAGDIGERAFAERIISDAVTRHGRVDILVNNAAMPKHKHILHTSPEEVEQVLRVNFMSAVWTTLAVIPPMLCSGGGTIVNVSSFAAKVSPPREAAYTASKAALNGFTESLWSDLAGCNIHVALINPGPIDTEIWLKPDEPIAYKGPKYPPEIVTAAIFEAIEKRRYEITVPRWSVQLMTARLLRLLLPSVLRLGMAKMDPVPHDIITAARAQARGRGPGDRTDS